MRVFAYLGFVVLGFASAPAFAADVTAADAKSIESKFSNFLPPALRAVLKLLPAGNHFDVQVDIGHLADTAQMPLHISKMAPIAGTITPRADGLWDIASHGDMVMMGYIGLGAEKTHFNVKAGNYQINTVYDPARGYPRSGNLHAEHWKFSPEAYRESCDTSADDYDIKYTISDAKDGKVDSHLESTAQNFWERNTSVSVRGKDFEISAASVSESESLTGVDLAIAQQVIKVIVGSGALSLQALNQTQQQRISDILKQSPFPFSSFVDNAEVSRPKIRYDSVEVSADSLKVAAKLAFDKQGGSLSIVLSAETPHLHPGAFPHPVELAMPDEVNIGMRFDDLKIQDTLDPIFKPSSLKADQKSKGWISQMLHQGSEIRINLSDTSVHSQYYDISLSGSFVKSIEHENERPDIDLTVTAHNLDKTVSFLQANANAVPWFGQASFVVLMAKGMGKQQSDGAFVWHIQTDKTGALMVNGHKTRQL